MCDLLCFALRELIFCNLMVFRLCKLCTDTINKCLVLVLFALVSCLLSCQWPLKVVRGTGFSWLRTGFRWIIKRFIWI